MNYFLNSHSGLTGEEPDELNLKNSTTKLFFCVLRPQIRTNNKLKNSFIRRDSLREFDFYLLQRLRKRLITPS